jgi:hypothetical protein
VYAAPSENVEVQAAQFGYGGYPMMGGYQNPMMGGYQNQMNMGVYGDSSALSNGAMNPSKYLDMKDEEFGFDYSMRCSNTCSCRSSCLIVWWQSCNCRCELRQFNVLNVTKF